jgi:hypothetical protein
VRRWRQQFAGQPLELLEHALKLEAELSATQVRLAEVEAQLPGSSGAQAYIAEPQRRLKAEIPVAEQKQPTLSSTSSPVSSLQLPFREYNPVFLGTGCREELPPGNRAMTRVNRAGMRDKSDHRNL